MEILKNVTTGWADVLVKVGLAKRLSQGKILWVKAGSWKMGGRVYIYAWDNTRSLYTDPRLFKVTRKEWES